MSNNNMRLFSTLIFLLQCTAYAFRAASNIGAFCKTDHKLHIACTANRAPRICSFRSSLSHDAEEEKYDRYGPNIVVISTPEDYVKFLEEDDGLCVIKFYASWCKSCAKFGLKYRKLALDYGDRKVAATTGIRNKGKVRFAEVEFNANRLLCKTLKVRSLPTVHIYKKGKGKVAEMIKRPSEFQDVVDEINRLLALEENDVAMKQIGRSHPVVLKDETFSHDVRNSTDQAQFEQTMSDGSQLAEEIMKEMKGQGREQKSKEESAKEKNWFSFPFSF